jgi:hypothetical protein
MEGNIHKDILEMIRRIYQKTGVIIKSVNVDWADGNSTLEGKKLEVENIHVESFFENKGG